ncbi:MAG: D-alanine--D-alanine ligase [Neisseriaceae bacterium]|nr:D-alanine--D-alanine ligase [Neisseriaceae bacterium]
MAQNKVAYDWGKIAVLSGGFSNEREVSLNSGMAVLKALKSKGIDAHLFDPKEQPLYNLHKQGFQAAFNVLHGTFGEDGVVQGALESMHIPYTGCGVLSSAISMDKYRTRLLWESVNLPNVPYIVLKDGSDFDAVEQQLGLPLFVKPACEGSSIGVVMIKEKGELAKVYPTLKQYRGEILAEKAISGGEYACAIIGNRALPTIRIIPKGQWYDFEAKYQRDDTIYQCPSDLSKSEEKKMQDLALKSFAAIDGSGWGRVDFLRDNNGELYLLEVNTVPGMTAHSLVPKAARQIGLEFPELCVEILKLCIHDK